MKTNKLFIFICMLLFSLVSVNAVLNDSILYYSFDSTDVSGSTMLDISGNSRDGNCNGMGGDCNTVSGLLVDASDFDGIDDTINNSGVNQFLGLTDTFTVNLWFKADSTSGTQYIVSNVETLSSRWACKILSNEIQCFAYNGGYLYQKKVAFTDTTNYHMLTIQGTGSTLNYYLDETQITTAGSGVSLSGTTEFNLGAYDGAALFYPYDGKMDELAIYDRVLNISEIATLYNGGNASNPYTSLFNPILTFTNITANNVTLINNTYYNNSINFESTILNTSTNANVNHSYTLTSNNSFNITSSQTTITNVTTFVSNDLTSKNAFCLQNTGTNYISHATNVNSVAIAIWNGSNWIDGTGQGVLGDMLCGGDVQYATNSLTGSFDLNLSEGFYNISFYANNNETNVSSSNFSFLVDRTNPVIQKLQNISEDSFEVNFSSIFNVTDALSGLTSCNINITELENVSMPDNVLINCTDSQIFQTAGLHNLFITAIDNAGNIQTLSENFTINPLVNIFFTQLNGSTVLEYNATIFHPDGRITFPIVGSEGQIELSPVNNGSLDLGNHTIQFSKLGFTTENFTQLLNETNAGINVTFNVTDSVIVIRIFDRETNTLLTGLTSITIQATQGFNGSTTTGLLNVSNINFISEQYQILAEHERYNTENVFFNYNNQQTLNVDIFMLNSTAVEEGQIKIIVKNSLSQFVESAVCSALEWRPSESAFVSVAQGLTNVIGETLLNIELNTKIYEFSCTKDTFTTITNAQIVQIDASSLTIILNDVILAPSTLFANLVTSLTNSSLNATHQLITFDFADSDGLTTQACLKVFLVNGNRQTFDTENCVSSSSGTLLLTVNTNQTSDILIQGTLTTSQVTDYVAEILKIKGIGDIAGQLKNIGLDILIPTMLILLGLGLGILLSKIEIAAVFIAIAGWVSVAFVPTIMKSTIAMFISVVVGLMLWGGFNRK